MHDDGILKALWTAASAWANWARSSCIRANPGCADSFSPHRTRHHHNCDWLWVIIAKCAPSLIEERQKSALCLKCAAAIRCRSRLYVWFGSSFSPFRGSHLTHLCLSCSYGSWICMLKVRDSSMTVHSQTSEKTSEYEIWKSIYIYLFTHFYRYIDMLIYWHVYFYIYLYIPIDTHTRGFQAISLSQRSQARSLLSRFFTSQLEFPPNLWTRAHRCTERDCKCKAAEGVTDWLTNYRLLLPLLHLNSITLHCWSALPSLLSLLLLLFYLFNYLFILEIKSNNTQSQHCLHLFIGTTRHSYISKIHFWAKALSGLKIIV